MSGVKGKAATSTYKLCGTYAAGYRSTAVSVVGGPKAVEKGRKTGEAILARYKCSHHSTRQHSSKESRVCICTVFTLFFSCCRTRNIFKQLNMSDYSRVNLQILGSEQTYGPHANRNLVTVFFVEIFRHKFCVVPHGACHSLAPDIQVSLNFGAAFLLLTFGKCRTTAFISVSEQ